MQLRFGLLRQIQRAESFFLSYLPWLFYRIKDLRNMHEQMEHKQKNILHIYLYAVGINF